MTTLPLQAGPAESDPRTVARLRVFAAFAGALVVTVGAVGLAGWMPDSAVLQGLAPGWATMKANTALGFVLAGTALWCLRAEPPPAFARRVGLACAGAVVLLGLLTLLEWIAGVDFGIDTLLFVDPASAQRLAPPGRMSPSSATDFVFCGLALLLLDAETRRGARPAQWLVLPPLAVAFIASLGYLYHADGFWEISFVASMAAHTALNFALLGLGILAARPRQGVMALVSSPRGGGAMLRRFIPLLLLVIPLLFWLRFQGERLDYYDNEFGIALMALTNIALIGGVIWWTAAGVDRNEIAQRAAGQELAASERRFRALVEQSVAGIYIIQDGRFRYANQALADILGYDTVATMFEQVSIAESVCTQDRQRVFELIRRREAGEVETVHSTARFLRRDGGPVDLEVFGRSWSHDGRPAIIGLLLDVSARVAAEAALRESEARLNEAQRIARIGSWTLEVQSGALSWSAEVFRIFELDPARFGASYEAFLEAIHPEDREAVNQAYRLSLVEKTPYEIIHRLRMKDGRIKYVQERGEHRLDAAAGTVALSLGTVQDISEQRTAELAAEQQAEELRWRNVDLERFTQASVGRELQMIELKRRINVLCGELGRPLAYDPPREDTPVSPIRGGAQEEQEREREAALNLMEDAVIARAQSEAANTALRKFAQAIEQSPASVLITDLQGRIEYANAAFLSQTGYGADEVIGRSPRFLQSGQTSQDVYVALWSHLTRGLPWKGEFINRRKDGSEYVDFAIITPLRQADGAITHYVGVQEDITERRRMGAELDRHRIHLEELVAERTAELEQARAEALRLSRVKTDFLANMSHEIRTPMNGILGLAYVLEHLKLAPEATALVRKIRLAGRSLLGIINEILDFSKIEANRIEIETAPFRLADVLDNLATLMAANVGDKDLDLIIQAPGTSVDRLAGDALRLEQVLVNLAGNAIKFTERGHVEVAVDLVAEHGTRATLRFSVRDTGMGISDEQQARVFEAFSQAETSTSRRFGGTGLGLTICHRLVALMGGELRVDSVAGAGSEFWFVLDLEREPGLAADGEAAALPASEPCRVLIADDNRVALNALRRNVEALGWSVVTADSGSGAVDQALRQGPDAAFEVVILDWKMPGMDGLAAARAIREAGADGGGPVILILSGYAGDELQARPDAVFADAVLTKPVTRSAIFDAVARIRHARQDGATASPGTDPQSRRLVGIRLLVVDDVDLNRDVAQLILGSEGAEVVLAEDGRRALDWLLAHQGGAEAVDMVLMDVQMPVMDGLAATRLIRRTPHMAALPVLAVTAGAFKEQEDEARAAGMTDVLPKPLDPEHAIEMILRHAGREGRAAPAEAHPATTTADAGGDYPGIKLDKALAIWSEVDDYRRYLRLFVDSYANFMEQLACADHATAGALAHKLKGTAATLALDDLAHAARALDQVLLASVDPAAASAEVGRVLALTLESVARFAPATPTQDAKEAAETLPPAAREQLAVPLARLLAAFGSDDRDRIDPALAALDALLPAGRLAAIHAAVEAFQLRRGEVATRALAAELGISLED